MENSIKDALIYDGCCQYCGQYANSINSFVSQMEADAWATSQCNCDRGRAAREILKNIERAKGILQMVCGKDCERNGFKPVDCELYEFLETMIDHVGRGELSAITSVLPGRSTITIKRNVKGEISVKRRLIFEVEMQS